MISKKKIREKVLDICNGAGLVWLEDEGCFEQVDGMANYGRAIRGIERSFGLGDDSRIRTPWQLEKFDSMEELVGLVSEAIEYDT